MRKALSSIEIIVIAAIVMAAGILIAINLPAPNATKPAEPPVQPEPVTNITQPPAQQPEVPPINITPSPPANVSVNDTVANETVPPAVNGLKGEYFSNIDFSGDVFTRTDPAIDMAWRNQEAPIEGISGSRFVVRWTGKIMVDKAGEYVFVITSDDGSRLYIDGTKNADMWDNSGTNSKSATITLSEGKHDIKIEYKNIGGGLAKMKLEYIAYKLNITRQVVPSGKLMPE